MLIRWRHLLADFTLAAADERRQEGTLEFHDLLVLARHLVRTVPEARQSLHERYTHLLIDEFQDTDPIQIELATLIASGGPSVASDAAVLIAEPGEATDLDNELRPAEQAWADLPIPDGRLCFVGDPKQSIYRFRRADIELFRAARERFAPGDRAVSLVQNFRTVPTVVEWINAVFAPAMDNQRGTSGVRAGALGSTDESVGAAVDDSTGWPFAETADPPASGQPGYTPLVAARSEAPNVDHRVVLLGGPHQEPRKADELRDYEAADVAYAIRTVMANPAEWPIERQGGWHAPRFGDIVVLVPSRLSLPALERALRAADIPYRAEASTLVFDTQEVRETLIVLQAIDDPLDEIATVAALRSPLFGCGDDELAVFVRAGGSWDYRRAAPASLPATHPVVEGLQFLLACHHDRLWLEPSELLERVLRERHAYEIALAYRRPRDVWRRLRFLVEQARQFIESNGGGLRDFLAWADMQRHEGARVHEPLLPEIDDDSVRVLTIHGAKGLEFPITIVSGLTTQHTGGRAGVAVRWGKGLPELKISGAKTAGFDIQNDFEAEMDINEKMRLLYVGCTRRATT